MQLIPPCRFGLACTVLVIAAPLLYVVVPTAHAQIAAPPGFTVDVLLDQIDGSTPRLEAVSNPTYGSGVVAAAINDAGILSVTRISANGVEILGVQPGFLPAARPGPNLGSWVPTIRFDRTGLYDHGLFFSVAEQDGSFTYTITRFFQLDPDGTITPVLGPVGGSTNKLSFIFEFVNGHDYLPGAYLEDQHITHGTSLWHADSSWTTTILGQNVLPVGRTDLDIFGMKFDSTGIYGHHLMLADSDDDDNKSGIYALMPDLTWTELTTIVPLNVRFYRDMDISTGGAFGQMIYVAEEVSQQIQTVDPDGLHTTFATGFDEIGSVAVSEDGNALYVSDSNGIYRIRPIGDVPGPTVLCHEPNFGPGGVSTTDDGVASARIIFNEPVLFTESDVTIIDEDGDAVTFSALGSNTQFLLIAFGTPLVNDIYTITVADTVASAAGRVPIDGDGDGISGGALTISFEHRRRADLNNDGEITGADLGLLLGSWGL